MITNRCARRAVVGIGMAIMAFVTLQSASRPLILAHRGASGHRPEHTREGYTLAVEMGADFIEPDLVSTKDGVLVARHENEIGATTDVADRFPDRRRTKVVDGQSVTGWFIEDFTLAEVKLLRARERLPFRSHAFDGQFEIPTFDEVVTLAQELSKRVGRPVGIYPETKHPSYFEGLGLPLEPALVATLDQHGWNRADAPVFIQSFEVANLRALRARTPVRLIQLLDERGGPWDRRDAETYRTVQQLISDAGLREIASYAHGIGANRRLVLPAATDGSILPATDLVRRAHAAGLLVHVWTLRSEPVFLPPTFAGHPEREYLAFRDLGVDAIFTDFPDVAARALATPAGDDAAK